MNKSENKDSANEFSGNEPAADPDIDAVESVVDDLGAVRKRTGIDSHMLSCHREPPARRPRVPVNSGLSVNIFKKLNENHEQCMRCLDTLCHMARRLWLAGMFWDPGMSPYASSHIFWPCSGSPASLHLLRKVTYCIFKALYRYS